MIFGKALSLARKPEFGTRATTFEHVFRVPR